MELLERIAGFGERTALISDGKACSYERLATMAESISSRLPTHLRHSSPRQVAFLLQPGVEWVAVLLGIWLKGDVAVPVGLKHPWAEIAFLLEDAEASLLILDSPRRLGIPRGQGTPCPLLGWDEFMKAGRAGGGLPTVSSDNTALLLYTSGSTGRPKGVALTHSNLKAQISTLVSAWGWSGQDHILHALPLNHTHGLINALLCGLWSGAACEFVHPFEPALIWEGIGSGRTTLFMGVPTMYARLIDSFKSLDREEKRKILEGSTRLRLAVSGSAALPLTIFQEWQEILGQPLLERYGMTEIGMALSNPLVGDRRPGTVGMPLPGVDVRLVGEEGEVLRAGDSEGEIEVRGPGVFKAYWRRPEETKAAFRDGWFRTGDMARLEDNYWKILGRKSTDIIKSGGYKVSALEVENVLLEHRAIREAAVVGVPDPVWGEMICAFVTLRPGRELSLRPLQAWARKRMASYKIPRALLVRESLPRNPIGKVIKPALSKLFGETSEGEGGR